MIIDEPKTETIIKQTQAALADLSDADLKFAIRRCAAYLVKNIDVKYWLDFDDNAYASELARRSEFRDEAVSGFEAQFRTVFGC